MHYAATGAINVLTAGLAVELLTRLRVIAPPRQRTELRLAVDPERLVRTLSRSLCAARLPEEIAEATCSRLTGIVLHDGQVHFVDGG